MLRRLAALAVLPGLVLALVASPVLASGSPLTRVSYDAATLGSMCGYTFTSGTITVTFRTTDAVVDPTTGEIVYIPAAHQALDKVVAQRDGASYKVVGRETYNDLKGHLTLKMMFVSKGGGIADSVNVVFRSDRDGAPHVVHDLGSCSLS